MMSYNVVRLLQVQEMEQIKNYQQSNLSALWVDTLYQFGYMTC